MPVTKDQAQMLATLAIACRPHGAPRWDHAGVMAALEKVRTCALADVMAATARAASDRDARTPAVIAATGSLHWREKVADSVARFPAKAGQDCRLHKGEHPDTCRSCAADRLAGERPEPLAPVADVVPITDRINHLRALAAESGDTSA